MATLPSADEFFSSAPAKSQMLPTADEFFGNPARVIPDVDQDVPASTPASDETWLHSSAKKVADAFGEGFGSVDELGLSDESIKKLRELGVFPDYEKGRVTVGKALNEVLFRPAAFALETALHGAAGFGKAAQEIIRQVALPLPLPESGIFVPESIPVVGGARITGGREQFARDWAAMPEAFFGGPGSFGPRPRHLNLREASDLKVIGHGESGWAGTSTKLDDVTPQKIERPEEPQAASSASVEAPQAGKPIEEQRAFIIGDVKEKLVAAGRPETEAEAAAAIDAAYWETRAARFEGRKGSAEEMYLRDAPEIVGGRKAEDAAPAAPRDLTVPERRKLDDLIADKRQSLRPEKIAAALGVEPEVAVHALGRLTARGDPRLRQTKDGFARKPARGPLSLIQFLASQGGIRDQGGELKALGLDKVFVPGFGPLIRPKGRSLDAARESAVEAGYMPEFGSIDDAMASSTTDDLLTRLGEDSGGRKIYSDFDRDLVVERDARRAEAEGDGRYKEAEDAVRAAAREVAEVTEDELREAAILSLREGMDPADALADVIERNAVFGREDQVQWARPERADDADVTKGTGEAGGRAAGSSEAPGLPRRAAPRGDEVGVEPRKGGRDPGSRREEVIPADDASEAFNALELDQTAGVKRGRIRLREDGRNTITLLKEANASTFIHEKGHDYLARLMMDAADDMAPAILKQDADTVLKWLGVEKASDIKTKQHEQFARGFEAYMREGVAPHPTLARVFEQFRQWLVRIYESVTRLRVDINEDIRGVYDRLLAVDPQRTGIIPDEAIKKAAEKFEELAVSARQDAGALADEAAENRAKLTGDAGLGGITEEARRSTPGRGDADRAGAESQIDAQRAGERAPTGAVSAGGSDAAAEGALTRGDANAALPRAETPFTDKAGNIRLENLGTPEDVNAVLRQTAAENEGFISARRGVLTDSEVSDLADALGMDAKQLNRRKIGEAFNAEQVVAARRLLVQSARSVRDAMAKASSGDEAAILAYAEAKTRHLMIQEQVSGLTAEAGRALRAFRALEGMDEAKSVTAFLQENTGKTLYQLQREAQMGMVLDTPAKVSKFVKDSTKPTWADMAIEAWINALLSGPKTHATNILGNTLVALYRVPETVVAAGVGKVRSAITGNQERVRLGEAGGRLFGFVQGAKDGVRAGWDVFKNEDLVEQVTKVEQRRFQAIPGKAGKIARLPGRALAAEDAVFRAIAHRQELNALAYRKAMSEGLKDERFARRVAELVEHPTDEMVKAAQEAASYQTFQTKLGRLGTAVQLFANSHPMVKLVIPFVRTPVNIIKFAQERSPFGLFSREVRENIAKGGASADTQIARIVMGSAVSTAAVAMALEGTITGGGPTDPKQRAVLFQTGWQPYSVKIGEHYYSYARLEPIAMLFGIAADMAEVGAAMTEKEADDVGKMVLASVAKNLTSKTWLSGPSELIKAVHDPDRYGERYIQRLAGTVVPTGVAQIAQTQDPYLREARTILDTIKSRVPGLSQTLLPRRDIWGEPIDLGGGLGPDLLSPIYESRLNNDPVSQALLRLNVFPSRISRKIRGVELTDEQYDDFARIAGRTMKMRLDSIVTMPGFAALPDFAQRELITKAINNSREAARSMMMMQHPSIIESAMEMKREALSSR